jgi:hypothetical protein
MFIPAVGDYISVRKGGRSDNPFDLAGTVRTVVYTAFEARELLSVTFENSTSVVYITPADEVQVH